MSDIFENIFAKESIKRKNACMQLCDYDLSEFERNDLRRLYTQLELMIEKDTPDIVFFAKKLISNIEETAKIKGLSLKDNPVDEIYSQNSDELVKLLASEDKIIRVNSIYALAKNGCSDKHIQALERFAENASEDEATLAIDSIEAIRNFIAERKKRDMERKRKRELALSSFNRDKEKKSSSGIRTRSKETFKPDNIESKGRYYLIILISLVFLTLVYNIYFYVFFSPQDFVPENAVIVEFFPSFGTPVIIYRIDERLEMLHLRFSFKGFVNEES